MVELAQVEYALLAREPVQRIGREHAPEEHTSVALQGGEHLIAVARAHRCVATNSSRRVDPAASKSLVLILLPLSWSHVLAGGG